MPRRAWCREGRRLGRRRLRWHGRRDRCRCGRRQGRWEGRRPGAGTVVRARVSVQASARLSGGASARFARSSWGVGRGRRRGGAFGGASAWSSVRASARARQRGRYGRRIGLRRGRRCVRRGGCRYGRRLEMCASWCGGAWQSGHDGARVVRCDATVCWDGDDNGAVARCRAFCEMRYAMVRVVA